MNKKNWTTLTIWRGIRVLLSLLFIYLLSFNAYSLHLLLPHCFSHCIYSLFVFIFHLTHLPFPFRLLLIFHLQTLLRHRIIASMNQMAAAALSRPRLSMLTNHFSNITDTRSLNPSSSNAFSFNPLNQPIRFRHSDLSFPKLHISCAAGGGDGNNGIGRRGGGGGGGRGDDDDSEDKSSSDDSGILGPLLSGWRDRVAADPQFPFKVLMEELVGVTACVLGDMASRPNFGLNELDFVFSTLVVGSIMNFTIMYLLAPKASASSSSLPSIFASCPQSHMFEPGGYTLMNRLGTVVFKGAVFAAVGFGAGLVGTAISNGLIKLRKKMDPNFETPNKAPPTLLNAVTWATHMGVSSNLRYQTLNGIEFLLERGVPPMLFKSSVVVLRCLNNVLGGMSFVILARMTGSQSVGEKPPRAEIGSIDEEKEKLARDGDNLVSK